MFQLYLLTGTVATVCAYNQGRLKKKEDGSWYKYYYEIAKIIFEEAKDLLNGEKKESFKLCSHHKNLKRLLTYLT